MSRTADGIRVIHVDDDPDFAEVTATFLEREDDRFSVATATSAEEAIDRLAADGFDCVVSDYEMPGEDGIDLLETVREREGDLPFILFTGKGNEEIASEAISAGVTDYLQKGPGTDQYTVLANRVRNAVEKARAEREAEQVRTHLQAIAEHTNDAIVLIDEESTIRFANPAIESLLGYAPADLDGESLTTLMPPRYRGDHQSAVERYLATGERTLPWESVEFHALHSDGHEVPVSVSFGAFERDGDRRFVGVLRDVSERIRMEEALREREERFRQMAENIGEVVWMTDPEKGEMLYVNPAYEEIWGRSVEDLYDDPESFLDAVHPEDRDRVRDSLADQPTGGYDEEYRVVDPDGEVRWVHDRAVPVEGDAGEVYRIVGIASEITERVERERELETLTDEYEAVVENTADGIFLVDVNATGAEPEFRFERLNPAHEAISGMTSETVRGKTPREALGADAGAEVAANYRRCVEARETISYEETLRMPNGAVHWETKLTPVIVDGTVTRLVGVARDVTERVKQERRLERQAERLDEFAGIVSHDLRNPLDVATGRLELARDECASEHLDAVERAHDRIEALIDDLLTLARDRETAVDTEAVPLAAVAEACWRNVEVGDATLVTEAERTIHADRSRLQQLIENLVRNAVEHGGDGVTVVVGDLDGGFYVADDGHGIPGDERDRVFEPGYSTADGGTGFGLAIVSQVVEDHGWAIRVTDGEEGGARFEIRDVDVEG